MGRVRVGERRWDGQGLGWGQCRVERSRGRESGAHLSSNDIT